MENYFKIINEMTGYFFDNDKNILLQYMIDNDLNLEIIAGKKIFIEKEYLGEYVLKTTISNTEIITIRNLDLLIKRNIERIELEFINVYEKQKKKIEDEKILGI